MAAVEISLAPPARAIFPRTDHLRAWGLGVLRHPLVRIVAIILAAPVVWLMALACVMVFMACEVAPARSK